MKVIASLRMSQQHQQMVHWGILISTVFFGQTNFWVHSIKVWRAQLQLVMERKTRGNLIDFFLSPEVQEAVEGTVFPLIKHHSTHTNKYTKVHKSLYYLHLVCLLVYFESRRTKAFPIPVSKSGAFSLM